MHSEARLEILRNASPNTWIALSADGSSLAGEGTTLTEALEAAKTHGEDDPILVKVPDEWRPMVLRVEISV